MARIHFVASEKGFFIAWEQKSKKKRENRIKLRGKQKKKTERNKNPDEKAILDSVS